MIVKCCICESEIYLSLDEFIELENETDKDMFCDECCIVAMEWIVETELRKN